MNIFVKQKMNLSIIFAFIVTLLVFGTNSAFAETWQINIPTGAADSRAPYFWQSEKDGSTDGRISILVGDTVSWENADTAYHTVTSGVPTEEDVKGDGIFDSGMFTVGESWSYRFTEKGTYPYFCTLHPWMIGTVVVGTGLDVIKNVGEDAGDGATTFDVEYDFNRLIGDARVDESQNAITFTILPQPPQNEDNNLTLHLPKNLISVPYVIWADGNQITNF